MSALYLSMGEEAPQEIEEEDEEAAREAAWRRRYNVKPPEPPPSPLAVVQEPEPTETPLIAFAKWLEAGSPWASKSVSGEVAKCPSSPKASPKASSSLVGELEQCEEAACGKSPRRTPRAAARPRREFHRFMEQEGFVAEVPKVPPIPVPEPQIGDDEDPRLGELTPRTSPRDLARQDPQKGACGTLLGSACLQHASPESKGCGAKRATRRERGGADTRSLTAFGSGVDNDNATPGRHSRGWLSSGFLFGTGAGAATAEVEAAASASVDFEVLPQKKGDSRRLIKL